MSSHHSRAENLRKYSKELFERIEFVDVSNFQTPGISRGILFLMAFWSGPAVRGFQNVCHVFSQTGLPEDFVFRVLDIDGASQTLLDQLSNQPVRIGGNGEGYWFRGEKIFATTNCATGTAPRIQQLIAESANLT